MRVLLTSAFALITLYSHSAVTHYYTIMNGVFETNIWSKAGHTGGTCTCTPGCSIPANSIIHIAHAVTSNCSNLNIGSNSTLIIEAGGSLTINPGNGNITGTGNLVVDAGGTLNITGNLNLSGNGAATVNGTVNVGGNVNFSGSSSMCGTGNLNVGGSITGGTPCASIILPIELLSFDAFVNTEGNVQLEWITATETNNDYFTLFRSFDGEHFTTIATVDGAGNSNTTIHYTETDTIHLTGLAYYRLSQTDYDGRTTFSAIRAVRADEAVNTDMRIYPNPNVGDFFTLESSGFDNEDVLVVLHDAQGKLYYSKVYLVKDHNQLIAVDLDDKLAPGLYMVSASSKRWIYSKRLIIR